MEWNFDEFVTHLRARQLSPRTVKRRMETVRQFSRWAAPQMLAQIRTTDLERWLARFAAPATAHAYCSDLRSYFGWLLERNVIGRDPTARLGSVRVPANLPRPVDDRELVLLLVCCANRRERIIVLLAAFAGLRCHEIARLDHADVDLAADLLRIRGKGGRERVVPLHPLLRAELGGHRGPVVPREDGRRMTADYVSRLGCRIFARAGLGGGLHRCRHWFGTSIQRGYHDLRVTQTLLGHSSPVTTAGYSLLAPSETRAAVRMLTLERGST